MQYIMTQFTDGNIPKKKGKKNIFTDGTIPSH